MVINVTHDRNGCIGCGACAAIADDIWEMAEDGKSKLKGEAVQADNGNETMEIQEDQLDKHKEAAEACPVHVIHIKKDEEEIV